MHAVGRLRRMHDETMVKMKMTAFQYAILTAVERKAALLFLSPFARVYTAAARLSISQIPGSAIL